MGAALHIDPSAVKVADFWKVRNDPFGALLRKRLRQAKTFPKRRFLCVYSEELPLPNLGATDEQCDYKAVINGSLAHITGIFGFTLAGLVIKDFNRKQ
jgi:tRNA A37 threonylcarbamoyladenosine dehydratase